MQTAFSNAVLANECSNTTDCSLSVFGAFSGSDRHSVSLTTGLQLNKIDQFAISTYFFNALAQVLSDTVLLLELDIAVTPQPAVKMAALTSMQTCCS